MEVEEVKFVSGDEKLRVFADALRNIHYEQTAPDETAIRILRRGKLSCVATETECTFVLALPADVRSID